MRYRYKGGKIEVVICNTRGIEIVRHAATSTIHKLEGTRREDRGRGESVFSHFALPLSPLLFKCF